MSTRIRQEVRRRAHFEARLFATAAIAVAVAATASAAQPVFNSGQASPLAVTPDATTIGDVMPVNVQNGLAIANLSNPTNVSTNYAVRFSADGTGIVLPSALIGSTINPRAIYSAVYAVNASGIAVGNSNSNEIAGPDYPTRWDAAGVPTLLGGLSTTFRYGTANAINDAGVTVGLSLDDSTGYSRATRWDANTTVPTALGVVTTTTLATTNSSDEAINAAGASVGYAHVNASGTDRGFRAVRWDAGSTSATALSATGFDDSTVGVVNAWAINAAGAAIGYAHLASAPNFGPAVTSGSSNSALRWAPGQTSAAVLGGLGTDASGASNAVPFAINASGATVGFAEKFDSSHASLGRRAVRWAADSNDATSLEDLAQIPGSTLDDSVAYGINDAGYVVGTTREAVGSTGSPASRATVWRPDGTALDLNTLLPANSGLTLFNAWAISSDNWVSGLALYDPDGAGGVDAVSRYFLIQVPEPTTLATSALGLLCIRRRRV